MKGRDWAIPRTVWGLPDSKQTVERQKYARLIKAAEQFLEMYDTQIPSSKQIEELAEEMRSGLLEAKG